MNSTLSPLRPLRGTMVRALDVLRHLRPTWALLAPLVLFGSLFVAAGSVICLDVAVAMVFKVFAKPQV